MTTPDRTEDLLRLMLERRAGAPPPGWLLPGVAEAVRHTGQVRDGRAWSGLLSTRRFGRLGLVAAAALVLLALVAGFLVAARLILPPPRPTLPAVVVRPSPSATLAPATPEPTKTPADNPQTASPTPETATPTPAAFAADTIAVVTTAGDRLRVRSAPGVGADSKKLEPLLSKGTRMLIVDGPVSADGYDWYEVRVADEDDGPSFGWVAAGKDGQSWIKNADPSCADKPSASLDEPMSSIEYLVCYGDAQVQVAAHVEGYPADTGGPLCRGKSVVLNCSGRPTWLFEPIGFRIPIGLDDGRELYAYAHGEARNVILNALEQGGEVLMSVGLDAPEAASCRSVDIERRDISRDELVAECRLRLTVRDAALAVEGP